MNTQYGVYNYQTKALKSRVFDTYEKADEYLEQYKLKVVSAQAYCTTELALMVVKIKSC